MKTPNRIHAVFASAVLAAGLGIGLASCAPAAEDDAGTEHAQTLSQTEASNLAAVKKMYADVEAGDIDSFMAVLHPDIVWNEAENNLAAPDSPYVGVPAIMEGVFGALQADWDYYNVEPGTYLVDGDQVAMFGRYSAKNKATGKSMNPQMVHLMTFKDGQVIAFQQHLDTLVQQQTMQPGLSYNTGDPAKWPPELDAVIAAPDNHKILLENDHVRVLEVTMAPNTVEPLHSHQWPSALYIQEAGDFIDRDGDGVVIMDSRTLPEPLEYPLTMWKAPEAPHSVENLSDTQTIRLIRVEHKTR